MPSLSKIAKTRRDVTRALLIAQALQRQAENGVPGDAVLAGELVQVLTDIDARTGRRDPRTRAS